MTLSGDSEQNQYLQDLVGFEGDNLEIAVDPASDSGHGYSDNTGNISLADFHSAPKFNKLIVGGVIALTCTILGFFFLNRSPVSSEVSASNEKPTEKASPLLEKSSQDSRVGQLKTEVALSDQQQALKGQKMEPQLPRSLTQSPRSTSASPFPNQRRAQVVLPPALPVRSRTLENSSPPSHSLPPRVAYRPVERTSRYVPPPLSIRPMPGSTVASLSPRASGATSARSLSYQFGVPSSARIDNKGLEPSRQVEIPPNYQVYYPNKGTDAANSGTDADSDFSPPSHQIASSVPAAKLVNATSPVALSPGEQRLLEGRPMMRSVAVGTQIFAQIFQATAVDNAQGYKVLVRVSTPLTDAQGNQSIPAGTLIGATLQIGAGGVARVTPEVIYLKDRAFPLPANSLIVALRDGNPLVAERVERGGERPGVNLLGLVVDTGTTLLPLLSGGGNNSNSFRDFYQFQRISDYTDRNFGGGKRDRQGGYSNQQSPQTAVYYKLPANLDVQLLVVAPFELPL